MLPILQAQEEALSAATLTSESQQASLSSLEQKLAQVIASFQSASEKDAEQIANLVGPKAANFLQRHKAAIHHPDTPPQPYLCAGWCFT